jgi:phosphatidylinositol glycan class B
MAAPIRSPTSAFERRCLLAAALLLLVAAWASIGFHQYDEHFQLLEFANFKLGLTPVTNLPWEFTARIRSWFQPAVALVVLRGLRTLGDADPFHAAAVLRLGSGLLFWAALARLVRCSHSWFRSSEIRGLAIAVACGLWFAPYLAVRFSGESWSGSLFFLGLASLIERAQGDAVSHRELGLAGVAMGLAFAARYQSAILIVAGLAWFVWVGRARMSAVAAVVAGIGLALVGSVLLDRWGYGVWTYAPWNYLNANLLHGTAASRFGASPPWWYLAKILIAAGPPVGLLLLAGVFISWWKRPANALTWVTAAFFLAHSLLGHKELRFLFPVLLAVPFLVCLSLDALPAVEQWWRHSRAGRALWYVLVLLDAVGLVLRLAIPARPEIAVQRAIYYSGATRLLIVGREDPFEMAGLNTHFYRRPGLVTDSISASSWGSDAGGVLQPFVVASRHPIVADSGGVSCQVLYRSFPAWVTREPLWSRLQWAEPRQWTLARCQVSRHSTRDS